MTEIKGDHIGVPGSARPRIWILIGSSVRFRFPSSTQPSASLASLAATAAFEHHVCNPINDGRRQHTVPDNVQRYASSSSPLLVNGSGTLLESITHRRSSAHLMSRCRHRLKAAKT
jgi:hypothetical protein